MPGARSVLVLAVVGVLTGAVAPPASAGAPIAVERHGDLFSFLPRVGLTRLTVSIRRERTPSWSPDHRRLAFVGGNRTLVWLDTVTGTSPCGSCGPTAPDANWCSSTPRRSTGSPVAAHHGPATLET